MRGSFILNFRSENWGKSARILIRLPRSQMLLLIPVSYLILNKSLFLAGTSISLAAKYGKISLVQDPQDPSPHNPLNYYHFL